MNLAEIAETIPVRKGGTRCSAGIAFAKLSPADQAKYLELEADTKRSNTWLSAVLSGAAEMHVDYQMVQRHRKRGGAGGCSCRR